MNIILPRITPHGGEARRIIRNSAALRTVGMVRGNQIILPRVSGGVSARTVLASVGIKSGTMLRVGAAKALLKPAVKTAKKIEPSKSNEGKPKPLVRRETTERDSLKLTEEERNLTGLLEAAQEMKPLADAVKEETETVSEVGGEDATEPKVEEKEVIIPELPMPLSRKKRGRKGKRARAAMMAAEQGLL